MKADFSRNTFDPGKHYSRVLEQQGRVQVDADFNEQAAIEAHRLATLARDVVGLTGAPNAGGGFGLGFSADGSDITLTSGRFYVDGLLCENDSGDAFEFTSTGDANATLATPRPDLAVFAVGQWVALSAAAGTQQQLRIATVSVTDTAVVLGLSAAIQRPSTPATGPFSGTLQRATTYLAQPDFPSPDHSATPTAGGAPALALDKGLYVAYLDVWERFIGALDDPSIRETALGGPDTAARAKTVWQLKLLQVTPPNTGQAPACGTEFPEWDALLGVASGGLAARAAPAQGQAGPCLIPPGGGYQGLENQLYRIEIHDPGADGTATFKWSRDNGSIVTPVQSFNGSTLTVAGTGPDDTLGLANGQWVEILGDFEELHGVPGQMIQIATVDPARATVTFASPPRAIDASLHPKMRRWDGATGLVPIPAGGSGWIDLEAGVQVALTPGQFSCGDYWQVPARSGAAASVEWNHATPQPPQGIQHHLARIGLLNWTGTVANSTMSDCRPAFAPLTDIPPALHITSISWQNDDVLSLAQFAAGLSLTLDGAPIGQYSVTLQQGGATLLSLMTANDSSMLVTIEMPIAVPNQPAGAAQPPTMPATVVLPGSPISWNGATNSLTWMPSAAATTIINSATGGQARVRVRLKGDFIWGDQGQQRLYLDGATRGQPGLSVSRPNTLRTDLVLPSGIGRRSSDFDSWFLLQFADTPVSLGSFFIAPGTMIGGGTPVAQVQLASVARAAVNVAMSATSQPQIAVSVGATAVVPVGQSNINVPVTINAPTSSSLVTVTATVPPVPNSTLATTLSASVLVVVIGVGVSPPSALLLVGATQRFTATVSGVGLGLPDGISTAVNWSCSGGAIDGSGVYTAPSVAGSFTVTATSVADPTRSAQAVVTVRTKGKDKDKDTKETKELKEVREKVVNETVVSKVTDVVSKVSDVVAKTSDVVTKAREVALPATPLAPRNLAAAAPATQAAFITPEERPQVGPAAATPAAAPASKAAPAPAPAASDDSPASPALAKKPVAKAAAKAASPPATKPDKK